MKIVSWIFAIIAATIMLQTLYFKFSAAPESVELFTKLGMEPWGRIGIGVAELISSILILVPASRFWGAFLGAGLMGGAIYFHLTVIGIYDNQGSPLLFVYAALTLFSCAIVLVIHRRVVMKYFHRKS